MSTTSHNVVDLEASINLLGVAIDRHLAEASRLRARNTELTRELELAADTFRDFSNVLRAIGKDTMAAAADVAERHIREFQGGRSDAD